MENKEKIESESRSVKSEPGNLEDGKGGEAGSVVESEPGSGLYCQCQVALVWQDLIIMIMSQSDVA